MGIYHAQWSGWVITLKLSVIYRIDSYGFPSSTTLSPHCHVSSLSAPSLCFRFAAEVNNVLAVSGRDNARQYWAARTGRGDFSFLPTKKENITDYICLLLKD